MNLFLNIVAKNDTDEPAVALVSEEVGGIYAYFFNEDIAKDLVRELNDAQGVDEDEEEKPNYTLTFDGDHTNDYHEALKNEELGVLVDEEGNVLGQALFNNAATQTLLKLFN